MKKNVILKTNICICIIIVLGFIATSMISYHSNRGLFRKDVESVTSLTAEGIYHQIDSIFTKPVHISLTMANDSLLKGFLAQEKERMEDPSFAESMRDYLLAYREKYNYDSVFLASAKTNRYYHFNGIDRLLEPGNPENDWYYAFLASDQEYSFNVDNDEVAHANNEITIFVNCKIREPDGSVMGVVGVGFRVNYIQGIFQDYESEYSIKAYLVDEDGGIQLSTNQTGYQKASFFENCAYPDLKDKILSEREAEQDFWYASELGKGYMASQFIPNLNWHLLIEYDTSKLEQHVNLQFLIGMLVILLVIVAVLILITKIIRRYNVQIVKLTIDKEQKHRSIFQEETAKIYENIYEIDITHNRAASEATEQYFESLGVPKSLPYDKALAVIASRQIKEEYRKGYIATFCPENVRKAYQDGLESLCYDFMISSGDGGYYWIRITARIFYWDEDKSVRMFVYRQNVDEEKRRESYMLEKMNRDSLTELYNKAATQEQIHRILVEYPEKQFAFFILDIDGFKKINDTYGHAAGDAVLRKFAKRLSSHVPRDAIVGRIGGDEFVAFFPMLSRAWIEQQAYELKAALRYDGYLEVSPKCTVTSSIGIAVSPEAGTDFESLYRNADNALYQTKKQGKDNFTIF